MPRYQPGNASPLMITPSIAVTQRIVPVTMAFPNVPARNTPILASVSAKYDLDFITWIGLAEIRAARLMRRAFWIIGP